MPKITNPKTLAALDLDYEEEGEEEYTGMEPVNGVVDIDQDEPEAFVPQFTVAPEEIPVQNVPGYDQIPTEEEQKNILEKMYARLGVKVNEAIHTPPPPMTPEKDAFVRMSARLSGGLLATVMSWVFMVRGYEYGVLAPNAEGMEKIVTPLWRIYARHSKLVGNITPDMEDIVTCLTAISAEALVSTQLLAQIREDKARHEGRPSEVKVRPSNTSTRYHDVRGFTPDGIEPVEDSEYADTVDTSSLTREQQFQYDALHKLSAKESENRYRRAGKL
jgi:hypothetical protein